MKKAFAWCDEHGVGYEFHDYKKQGVPRDRLVAWCKAAGWKTLLNTKGTTFRKLSPEDQEITTQSGGMAAWASVTPAAISSIQMMPIVFCASLPPWPRA